MSHTGLLVSLPLFVLLSSEAIYRGTISSTLHWAIHYPNQFIVSYAILFGMINVFYLFPRKIYMAFGAFFLAFFSTAGLVSRHKLLLRGEPLLPWDFRLGKEALTITQSFEGESSPDMTLFLIILLITVVMLISLFLFQKEKYQFGKKAITAFLSFCLVFSISGTIPLEQTFSLRLINWSQKSNYEENGMLLGFLLNTKYLSVDAPGDYHRDTVNRILGQASSSYSVDPEFTPNVIVVMSEAFWDPSVLEDITFSQDPLPYFHSLQRNHTYGTLLSPVYGGGTANTEFEVLTGLSTQFLPQGMIPYVQFVHKPLEALPAIFKRQGYEATAIHTYDNWFYRRNMVYQDLGFDRFISKEFFTEPEYCGPYIRDTELSHKILYQIRQSQKPDFIFAVSMQGHGPYPDTEEPDNTIRVGGDLTPKTLAVLENYTNTLADVDKSLEILIEGVKQIHEPTMVVFFGDHLPMLGNNFDVYRESGFFQEESSYTDYLNKYSVPFVVWDNFSRSKEELRLSASFLVSYILEQSRKEGSPLTDFLNSLNRRGSNVITNAYYLDREKITDEELAEYRLLQYDFLLGNEYAYQLKPLHKPSENKVYTLGDQPATIVEVLIPDQVTVEVLGNSFSENHQIYVNNEPIHTNFIDDTLLTATLTQPYLNNTEPLQIQVKLADSMKNVISESNVYVGSQSNNHNPPSS